MAKFCPKLQWLLFSGHGVHY